LAVDQMTTFDLEDRRSESNSWAAYAEGRRRVKFEDEQDREYQVDSDGVIRSVENLRSLENVSAVVLSIGGNDVYLNSSVQSSLAMSLLPSMEEKRQEVAVAFGARLRKIVKSVQKAAAGARIILVIPYQPHNEFSLVMGAPINADGERVVGDVLGDFGRIFERENLSNLVTPMVKEMLAVARETGCPVVDLSQTLDPDNEEHYGTGRIGQVNELGVPWSGAEPSDVSSGFIADLLLHALSKSQKSVIYIGTPRQEGEGKWSLQVKEEPNDVLQAEDYCFGGRDRSKSVAAQKEETDSKNLLWFGIGVVGALAVNAASFLSTGDVIGLDRKEYEKVVQEVVDKELAANPGGETALNQ